MRNIKLTIAYDGTNYSGWQIQPNGVTIQGLLQSFVRKMTGEKNNLIGAGRTDAGVHALAMVAAFKTTKKISLTGFYKGLNSYLPKNIRVVKVEEADIGFNPRKDAKKKCYRYLISEEPFEHPLNLNKAWCVGRKLNISLMKKAAKYLVGRHDFSAFRAADGNDNDRVREIFSISIYNVGEESLEGSLGTTARLRRRLAVYPSSPPLLNGLDVVETGVPREPSSLSSLTNKIIINITGNGFLKNMVRNIVGTLYEIGIGKRRPSDVKKILTSKDRKKAGVCAPAHGLYLLRVFY